MGFEIWNSFKHNNRLLFGGFRIKQWPHRQDQDLHIRKDQRISRCLKQNFSCENSKINFNIGFVRKLKSKYFWQFYELKTMLNFKIQIPNYDTYSYRTVPCSDQWIRIYVCRPQYGPIGQLNRKIKSTIWITDTSTDIDTYNTDLWGHLFRVINYAYIMQMVLWDSFFIFNNGTSFHLKYSFFGVFKKTNRLYSNDTKTATLFIYHHGV